MVKLSILPFLLMGKFVAWRLMIGLVFDTSEPDEAYGMVRLMLASVAGVCMVGVVTYVMQALWLTEFCAVGGANAWVCR